MGSSAPSIEHRFAHGEESVVRVGDLELDLHRYRVRRAGSSVPITAMQCRLLRYLMERPSTVVSRKRLLRDLWEDEALDEGTVTAGIVRLRRALGIVGGPDLIRNVRGQGYRFVANPDS